MKSEIEAGCLGQGTEDAPLLVFGDASGGKDTHDPRLRRVGIAVTVIESLSPFQLGPHVLGPLPGPSQTVPRGEIAALDLVIRSEGWP
eukprot:7406771-Pyramimonas_sp.AAC.1